MSPNQIFLDGRRGMIVEVEGESVRNPRFGLPVSHRDPTIHDEQPGYNCIAFGHMPSLLKCFVLAVVEIWQSTASRNMAENLA